MISSAGAGFLFSTSVIPTIVLLAARHVERNCSRYRFEFFRNVSSQIVRQEFLLQFIEPKQFSSYPNQKKELLLTTTIAPVEKFDLTDDGRLSVDASLSFSIWIGYIAVMPIVDVTALERFVNCCLGMTMVSWVRQHASHSNGYKFHEGVGIQSWTLFRQLTNTFALSLRGLKSYSILVS